jgi:hypothetical protein
MVVFCFDYVFSTLLGDLNLNGAKVSQNVRLCEKKRKIKSNTMSSPYERITWRKIQQ